MRQAKGLTFIGMLMTMAAVILLGLLAFRIVPVYIEHYAVTKALNSVSSLPNNEQTDNEATENSIRRALLKQFDIDSVTDVNENNISFKPLDNNKGIVTVQYQVVRPFVGNISLLFNFNDSKEVTLGKE